MIMKRIIIKIVIYAFVASLLWYIHYGLSLIFVLCTICNYAIKKHIEYRCLTLGRIQNADLLIVGDTDVYRKMKDYETESGNAIIVLSRNRSLEASYELVRTLFSLVREDGKGNVKVYANTNKLKGLTLYDVKYFHPTSLYKKGINFPRLLRDYPLWCYLPFKAILLFSNSRKSLYTYTDMMMEMKKFCYERNIKIKIYTR